MSGPVSTTDVPGEQHTAHSSSPPTVERIESRSTEVGGMAVARALPRRTRRTIGAWCFLDRFEPASPGDPSGMQVGPHPHIGLQTVTWLTEGAVDHRDSLGVNQRIVPRQLNLMTAGHGVSHAEQTPEGSIEPVRGAQLWIALNDDTRSMEPAFEHHAELPQLRAQDLAATVLVGELGAEHSPATVHSPLVGAAVTTFNGTGPGRGSLPLNPLFEHGLVVLEGSASLLGPPGTHPEPLSSHELVYLGLGRDELAVELDPQTQLLLIGGEPFDEEPLMWWNFVGRTWDEISSASDAWEQSTGRFGSVDSPLAPMPAPDLPERARRS